MKTSSIIHTALTTGAAAAGIGGIAVVAPSGAVTAGCITTVGVLGAGLAASWDRTTCGDVERWQVTPPSVRERLHARFVGTSQASPIAADDDPAPETVDGRPALRVIDGGEAA